MAQKTYLEIVNNVLTRLREIPVTSVGDTEYSSLIAVMVNDSKREIENATDWSALRRDIVVTTASGVSSYSLTGAGTRFRLNDVLNVTSKIEMTETSDMEIQRNLLLNNVSNNEPSEYNFKGVDTNGDAKVTFYPTPDGVYSIRFNVVVPQDDLVNSADTVSIPAHLIELLTYAKAIAERGEDGGSLFNEVYAQFTVNLADAIALEKGRQNLETIWSVV